MVCDIKAIRLVTLIIIFLKTKKWLTNFKNCVSLYRWVFIMKEELWYTVCENTFEEKSYNLNTYYKMFFLHPTKLKQLIGNHHVY